MYTLDEKDQYKTIAATLLLVILIIVLLSPPEVLLQRGMIVDTTSSYTSSEKEWVKTRMALGSNEIIEELPMDIDIWKGYGIEIKQNLIDTLNPDMIMERVYYSPNVSRPVWLLIIRAHNTSVFHDPKVCYRGAGWSVVNEEQCEITLNGSVWATDTSHKGNEDVTISVNELLIEKDGRERLIKYFYLKELLFASSPGSITIVRAEMSVDDLDNTSQWINDFYSEMLPYLFMPVIGGGDSLGVVIYKEYGIVGALLEVIIIIVVLGYIGYLIKKKPVD